MTPEQLKNALCAAFCSAFEVHAVAAGYAVSSIFTDRSGDRIGFYVVESEDGYRVEDDGEYLSRLIASGVELDKGQRSQLLDAVLAEGRAYWDRDSLEIRTGAFPEGEIADRAASFLSALIRARDIELLTREFVRSTFREDAMQALTDRFGEVAEIEENVPVHKEFEDFASDVVLRPKGIGRTAALYLVTNNEKLSEALLLQQEARLRQKTDFAVIALIEDLHPISPRKFQRAQNRDVTMPIFRGDEAAALDAIARKLDMEHHLA